jgi:hypothetical protein
MKVVELIQLFPVGRLERIKLTSILAALTQICKIMPKLNHAWFFSGFFNLKRQSRQFFSSHSLISG